MTLLRRVLYLQAATATLAAIGLIAFPGFLVETLLGQPAYVDYAWVRLVGVQAIALSMLIVLVARRVEELWWWAWAMVAVAFGTAAVTTLHALVGLPPGAAAWPWWGLGLYSWLISFGLLRGIGQAGAEKQAA